MEHSRKAKTINAQSYILTALSAALIAFTLCAQPSPAYADETYGKDYGGPYPSPYSLAEYSRKDSTVMVKGSIESVDDIELCNDPDVECRDLEVDHVTLRAQCTGIGNDEGGWKINAKAGECFKRFVACYGTGTPAERCYEVTPENSNPRGELHSEPWSQCSTYTSPANKQYCIHNYTGTTGVTGDTGDDMFRVNLDAQAFFEYKRIGGLDNEYRLKWIERGIGPDRGLMMPSGPAVTYADYKNFTENYPTSVVTVEDACYPTKFDACKNIKLDPPSSDGVCGDANGQTYEDMNDITDGDHCHIGTLANMSQDSQEISWTCSGHNQGNNTTCYAHRDNDAYCGEANEQTYASKNELEQNELCKAGTASTIAGEGPWSWQCDTDTGETASCFALKDGDDCENFYENDNMILVQDLTGSFGDDLPNIESAMESLFNNSAFEDWNVGVVSFKDKVDSWLYKKELDFTVVKNGKDEIINTIGSFSASGGGNEPEAQFHAMNETIDEFNTQRPRSSSFGERESYTIVLITDATSHMYVSPDTVAAKINHGNHRLIVLGTANVQQFYENNILNRVPGEYQVISSDSSNFAEALTEGLLEVQCESP